MRNRLMGLGASHLMSKLGLRAGLSIISLTTACTERAGQRQASQGSLSTLEEEEYHQTLNGERGEGLESECSWSRHEVLRQG